MFEKFLKRSSWTDIVISIIFVIFGVLLVSKPEATVGAISVILGILFIAMGALKLIEYYTSDTKEDLLLTVALVAVIFGIIVIFASDSVLAFFRVILGIWIIAEGLRDFQTTLVWKDLKSGYWTLALICSMIIIIAGIAILINTTLALRTVGIAIVIYAVLDIVARCIFMKKIKDYIKE